jgi:hypothetical protein
VKKDIKIMDIISLWCTYTIEIRVIQLIISKIDSIIVIKIKDFFITKIMPRVYKL